MTDYQYQQPTIEAEVIMKDDGQFSDYGESIASETQSLPESLFEYLENNGRRYHTYFGPDKNPLPTDAPEQERLDIVSEMIFLSTGTIHQTPLQTDKLHNVLDLGTGTGIWAIDFAQEYPQAQVLGIDITPIQPNWVPPNCHFEIDDFELEWNYHTKFDFINARTIAQSVTDWSKLLGQAKSYLNPGGFIEIGEAVFTPESDDNSMPADWPPAVVFGHVSEALAKMGRTPPDGLKLKQLVEEAGFINVTMKRFKLPVGTWPKDPSLKQAGALGVSTTRTGYESYALKLCTTVLGMDAEKTKALCKRAEACHYDRKSRVHMYFPYVVIYGQKPE